MSHGKENSATYSQVLLRDSISKKSDEPDEAAAQFRNVAKPDVNVKLDAQSRNVKESNIHDESDAKSRNVKKSDLLAESDTKSINVKKSDAPAELVIQAENGKKSVITAESANESINVKKSDVSEELLFQSGNIPISIKSMTFVNSKYKTADFKHEENIVKVVKSSDENNDNEKNDDGKNDSRKKDVENKNNYGSDRHNNEMGKIDDLVKENYLKQYEHYVRIVYDGYVTKGISFNKEDENMIFQEARKIGLQRVKNNYPEIENIPNKLTKNFDYGQVQNIDQHQIGLRQLGLSDQQQFGLRDQQQFDLGDQQQIGLSDQQQIGHISQQQIGHISRQQIDPVDHQTMGNIAHQTMGNIAHQTMGNIAHQTMGNIAHQTMGHIDHQPIGHIRQQQFVNNKLIGNINQIYSVNTGLQNISNNHYQCVDRTNYQVSGATCSVEKVNYQVPNDAQNYQPPFPKEPSLPVGIPLSVDVTDTSNIFPWTIQFSRDLVAFVVKHNESKPFKILYLPPFVNSVLQPEDVKIITSILTDQPSFAFFSNRFIKFTSKYKYINEFEFERLVNSLFEDYCRVRYNTSLWYCLAVGITWFAIFSATTKGFPAVMDQAHKYVFTYCRRLWQYNLTPPCRDLLKLSEQNKGTSVTIQELKQSEQNKGHSSFKEEQKQSEQRKGSSGSNNEHNKGSGGSNEKKSKQEKQGQ